MRAHGFMQEGDGSTGVEEDRGLPECLEPPRRRVIVAVAASGRE